MTRERILVTGAYGQIGSVLTKRLREIYGVDNVLATDIRQPDLTEYTFEVLNVLDVNRLADIIRRYKITQIYHLAAILSAKGEQAPLKTWDINMNGLFNVLQASKDLQVKKIFFPSSIAIFGDNAQQQLTDQYSFQGPSTVYGMSKVAGENWCQYFHKKYDMDIRSLRYPGLIGYESMPGGGTTDYAVDIYHEALKKGAFSCFLKADSSLPMMYMDDAIRATTELMEAPAEHITVRTSYNVSAMSFSPEEITASIQKHLPTFTCTYDPDYRQEIANSWPESIDDAMARKEWNWKEEYDLEKMTKTMLVNLAPQYNKTINIKK